MPTGGLEVLDTIVRVTINGEFIGEYNLGDFPIEEAVIERRDSSEEEE